MSRNQSKRDPVRWRRPALSITSTDREILDEVQRLCDGTICNVKKYRERMKPSWVWKLIAGEKVLALLRVLVPHLRCPLKEKRARYLIAGYASHTKKNGQYTEVEIIKKRLWEEGFFDLGAQPHGRAIRLATEPGSNPDEDKTLGSSTLPPSAPQP